MRDLATGRGSGPDLELVAHPDLSRVMCSEWLGAMENWFGNAQEQLLQCISNRSVEFGISRFGGCMWEGELSGKMTRVQLHKRSTHWTIILEPLAHYPDESFFSITDETST